MSSLALLIFGLSLLFLGGELLVRGSVSIALKLRISTLVVGMTIVSFATSAPELFVSIQALLEGSSSIALGSVIGSNIANIALVLAITALIFRVQISQQTINLYFPFLLLSSILFGLVLYYFNGIPHMAGYLFLASLMLFVFLLIKKSRKEYSELEEKDELSAEVENDSVYKSIIFLIVGCLFLKFGADNLVNGAIIIADYFQVSERIIAVTIVAIGTSMPELAASIVAAFRKQNNLAIGNLIGSNIFNILAVLGISSMFQKIMINDIAILHFDYICMIAVTFFLAFFIYIFGRREICRIEGSLLLLTYIIYLYFTLIVLI